MKTAAAQSQNQVQSRAAGYGFLAWLFLEQPDRDFVARLLADEAQDDIRVLARGAAASCQMASGLQEMSSSLAWDGARSAEEVCLGLGLERTLLLRGVAPKDGPLPPYESLYRSPGGRGETSVLAEVAEFHRQAQVERSVREVDQIDYLGLELDLMRLLCEEEEDCRERGDAKAAQRFAMLQRRFLQEHLLAWVPRFCKSLLAHPKASFYRGVSRLLLGFLEGEAAEVEVPSEYQEHSTVIPTGIGKGG